MKKLLILSLISLFSLPIVAMERQAPEGENTGKIAIPDIAIPGLDFKKLKRLESLEKRQQKANMFRAYAQNVGEQSDAVHSATETASTGILVEERVRICTAHVADLRAELFVAPERTRKIIQRSSNRKIIKLSSDPEGVIRWSDDRETIDFEKGYGLVRKRVGRAGAGEKIKNIVVKIKRTNEKYSWKEIAEVGEATGTESSAT